MGSTNDFSVNACYAVLSACPGDEPLQAILKMVVTVIEEQKYSELDPQLISKKFFERFHFRIPYHPMQIIIRLGIEKGYFEYNSSLKTVHPKWDAIDSGEFLKMLKEQENEYQTLLNSFDQFLQKKYGLHSSNQDLSDQVQAFVQRYGLVSKTNKKILRKVKNDFRFADYLLNCYDQGDTTVLDCIDRYTIGVAFAETLTFHVPTQKFKNCHANVYLDTGFIFALLGIESKDRSENFQDLFNDMVNLGMTPKIYQHTYDEIAGIIDTARAWINNPAYNPALASQTAYFFLNHNWSYQKATELLGDLRKIITEDFHIQIENRPYPPIENIRTKYEEEIKQLIIAEYLRRNEKFLPENKDYTISQDARSLFMTMHLDNGHIAHTLSDVDNIFITTNRTLAKVGKQLTREIVRTPGMHIPIALTDLSWGTLIWANSPAKVSPLNRANIISAAYAAFQPSVEILSKLNKSLQDHQASGELSAEKCYFLKTNAIALRVLSQKTQNDESNYSDETPFEILKELQTEGYNIGISKMQKELNQILSEKQKEMDQVISEKQKELESIRTSKEQIRFNLAIEKQNAVIKKFESEKKETENSLNSVKQHLKDIQNHLKLINDIKEKVDYEVTRKCKIFNSLLIAAVVIYVLILCVNAIENSWFVSLVAGIVPAFAWGLSLIAKHELTPKSIIATYRKRAISKVTLKYHFNQSEYDRLNDECNKAISEIKNLENDITSIADELKIESSKINQFSVDIDLTT